MEDLAHHFGADFVDSAANPSAARPYRDGWGEHAEDRDPQHRRQPTRWSITHQRNAVEICWTCAKSDTARA